MEKQELFPLQLDIVILQHQKITHIIVITNLKLVQGKPIVKPKLERAVHAQNTDFVGQADKKVSVVKIPFALLGRIQLAMNINTSVVIGTHVLEQDINVHKVEQ